MNLIASLRPMLKGTASVELVLAEEGEALTVLIKPKLANIDPDTSDPELAKLQAALARPLKITLQTGDPDAELAQALSTMAEARSQNADAMQRYREDQQQASAAAEAERQKKASATKKKATPAKPAKAPDKATAAPEPAPLPDATEATTEPPADAPAPSDNQPALFE